MKKSKKDIGTPEGQVKVSLNHVRISPQKCRLVIDLIKGRQVDDALNTLKFTPKKGARLTERLIRSAVAAADQREMDLDKLWVSGGWVNMGVTLRRSMPRAQGRATPIRKRSSHITVVLEER